MKRLEVAGGKYHPAAAGAFPSANAGYVHVYMVRFPADVPADLTPAEAREFAAMLLEAAFRVERDIDAEAAEAGRS